MQLAKYFNKTENQFIKHGFTAQSTFKFPLDYRSVAYC